MKEKIFIKREVPLDIDMSTGLDIENFIGRLNTINNILKLAGHTDIKIEFKINRDNESYSDYPCVSVSFKRLETDIEYQERIKEEKDTDKEDYELYCGLKKRFEE